MNTSELLTVKKTLTYIIFSFLFVFTSTGLSAQDSVAAEKHSSMLGFSYLKRTDGVRVLSATASAVINRQFIPLVNCQVRFFCSDKEVAVIETDNAGKALLLIDASYKQQCSDDGSTEYKAVYEGNDTIEETESSVQITDISLKLNFSETDSLRIAGAKAYQLSPGGDTIPVKDITLIFAVKRMFSNLKIGEGTTDKSGFCSCEFPKNIPGDSIGRITILVRIEENELYANVEASGIKTWGLPTKATTSFVKRELWTEIAPVWMIITLFTMLTGVWAHYFYVAFNIYRIKREGKKIEKAKKEQLTV